MKNRNKQYELPRFRKALEAFSHQIPTVTHWRYRNGMLPPPFGRLLVEHPELAEALAEDARDLAAQQKEEKGTNQ